MLHVSTTIPKLLDPESMGRVEEEVEAIRPVGWAVDPFYLSASKADMRNLFSMGEASSRCR